MERWKRYKVTLEIGEVADRSTPKSGFILSVPEFAVSSMFDVK